jgi:hypothetical protein
MPFVVGSQYWPKDSTRTEVEHVVSVDRRHAIRICQSCVFYSMSHYLQSHREVELRTEVWCSNWVKVVVQYLNTHLPSRCKHFRSRGV